MKKWFSLSEAAEYLGVHPDTILRRAIRWQGDPVPYKIRWKFLKLGENTSSDRRYWVEDLEALLVAP